MLAFLNKPHFGKKKRKKTLSKKPLSGCEENSIAALFSIIIIIINKQKEVKYKAYFHTPLTNKPEGIDAIIGNKIMHA